MNSYIFTAIFDYKIVTVIYSLYHTNYYRIVS